MAEYHEIREDADSLQSSRSSWFEDVFPKMTEWAPSVQYFPRKLAKRSPKYLRYGFTVIPVLTWALIVALLSSHSLFAFPTIDGHAATFVRCDAGLGFWAGPNAQCGLNGEKCIGEYKTGDEIRFKCPANCIRESWTYTPMPVGTDIVYHESMLVGGDNTYRADSFICAAAMHRGIISNKRGGCGILKFTGPQANFIAQKNNSIQSFGFDSEFVDGYSFVDTHNMEIRGCDDKRNPLVAVSFIALVLIGYWSVNTRLFVYSSVSIGFWTVILGSNPPWNGGTRELNAEVISFAARRLLPLLLCMYTVYELAVKGALKGMHLNLSRALCWVLPFFVGIVENYAFGYIPIDRLTVSDLNGQAGAWIAFGIIAVAVLAIIIGQAWLIYRKGKLVKYLVGYLLVVPCLFILGSIDLQTLRIHHYILALIFLPGTGFQTHYSLVYNGLLTGLFVAGIARWDFDSIIQTYEQLRRGGPEENTGWPQLLEPSIGNSTILRWASLAQINATGPQWNGFSLLINDVERYRGNLTSFNLTEFADTLALEPSLYYVRVALANIFNDRTGRFTMAGVLNSATGQWTGPEAGFT